MKKPRILDLVHYGLSFDNEEQLAIARHFYEDVLGFEYIVHDDPRVIWYRMRASKAELHIYYDPQLPRLKEPIGDHGAFEVDDLKAMWALWEKLNHDGWTHDRKVYPMARKAYRAFPLPGVKGRIHAWDPWGHHLEFWEYK